MRKIFASIAKADRVRRTACGILTSACALWKVPTSAKLLRTAALVEMIEKYYAAHIKTSLDAAAINVIRPKKSKKGKKAIRNTQASTQRPDEETDV